MLVRGVPMLDHDAIAALIPHAGRMCLLARVLQWDANGIRCAAVSHRDADNPLREGKGLPAWAAIEYAAQAAAVHGGLLHPHSQPRAGVLAALRKVETQCEWLDQIDGELIIDATLLHSDAAGGIYRFQVNEDERLLIGGQFTLMYRESMPRDSIPVTVR